LIVRTNQSNSSTLISSQRGCKMNDFGMMRHFQNQHLLVQRISQWFKKPASLIAGEPLLLTMTLLQTFKQLHSNSTIILSSPQSQLTRKSWRNLSTKLSMSLRTEINQQQPKANVLRLVLATLIIERVRTIQIRQESQLQPVIVFLSWNPAIDAMKTSMSVAVESIMRFWFIKM
jgi:hypothetical protein